MLTNLMLFVIIGVGPTYNFIENKVDYDMTCIWINKGVKTFCILFDRCNGCK